MVQTICTHLHIHKYEYMCCQSEHNIYINIHTQNCLATKPIMIFIKVMIASLELAVSYKNYFPMLLMQYIIKRKYAYVKMWSLKFNVIYWNVDLNFQSSIFTVLMTLTNESKALIPLYLPFMPLPDRYINTFEKIETFMLFTVFISFVCYRQMNNKGTEFISIPMKFLLQVF